MAYLFAGDNYFYKILLRETRESTLSFLVCFFIDYDPTCAIVCLLLVLLRLYGVRCGYGEGVSLFPLLALFYPFLVGVLSFLRELTK